MFVVLVCVGELLAGLCACRQSRSVVVSLRALVIVVVTVQVLSNDSLRTKPFQKARTAKFAIHYSCLHPFVHKTMAEAYFLWNRFLITYRPYSTERAGEGYMDLFEIHGSLCGVYMWICISKHTRAFATDIISICLRRRWQCKLKEQGMASDLFCLAGGSGWKTEDPVPDLELPTNLVN